jgi:hypothetical protein
LSVPCKRLIDSKKIKENKNNYCSGMRKHARNPYEEIDMLKVKLEEAKKI